MSTRERLEEIDLNITNRCNIGCSHCLFSAGPDKGDDLPIGIIEKLLVDGRKLGAQEVHVSGGEPTVRSDYLAILQMAHDLGFFVRLQTNLFSLPAEDTSAVLKYSDEVLTSIDGLKETHDLIRKPDSFRRTTTNIQRLIEAGKRVVVVTAVQKRNLEDIPQLVDFLIKSGVNAHFLFSVTPLGRAKTEDVVSPEQWEQLIARLHGRYKDETIKTDVVCELHHLRGDEEISFKKSDCRLYTRNHALVLPTGEVFPCSMFTSTDKSLGNVNREPFNIIWEQSPVWEFYSSRINDPDCQGCKLWGLCKGGCPGYSYILTGNIEKKDPRCQPGLYPVCPSWKQNIQDSTLSCSTWRVMKR